MMPCGIAKATKSVELTFRGQSITVNLPRSLVNGVMVVGATSPASMTSTSSSASATSTSNNNGKKVDTGSIVAAAVGAGVLLLGLPFGIKVFIQKRRWKRMQRPRRLQEREMRRQWAEGGNPYIRQDIPVEPTGGGNNFLFSQDWRNVR